MAFIDQERIQKILNQLLAKRDRQQNAIDNTNAELEHWQDQLELFKKTEKGATK